MSRILGNVIKNMDKTKQSIVAELSSQKFSEYDLYLLFQNYNIHSKKTENEYITNDCRFWYTQLWGFEWMMGWRNELRTLYLSFCVYKVLNSNMKLSLFN